MGGSERRKRRHYLDALRASGFAGERVS